jgi:integrase
MVDFNTCAAKYIRGACIKSLDRDECHIRQLTGYIGELDMADIYRGEDPDTNQPTALEQYVKDRVSSGVSRATINYALKTLNKIGRLATEEWRRKGGKPFIESFTRAYLIKEKEESGLVEDYGLKPTKEARPLSPDEQVVLFKELPDHLQPVFEFGINTGCRDQELCNLRWDWLKKIDDTLWYFELPKESTKNNQVRPVVLNSIAKSIVESLVGNNSEYVFSYNGRKLGRLNKSAYRKARDRAGKVTPGILQTNVHSLRHSFGERLTESDVPWDWKQALLGHNPKEVTWRYSHYYKGKGNLFKLLEFIERLVKYTPLDESLKLVKVA